MRGHPRCEPGRWSARSFMLVYPDIHFGIVRERLQNSLADAGPGRLAIRARRRRRRSADEEPRIEHAATQHEMDLAAWAFYSSPAAREPLDGNARDPARWLRLTRSGQNGAG